MSLADRYGVQRAAIAVSAAGDTQLVAAQGTGTGVAGEPKKIVVLGVSLVNGVATAQTVLLKSGSTVIATLPLPSSIGGAVTLSDSDAGIAATAKGQALNLNLSAATAVDGFLSYVVPST